MNRNESLKTIHYDNMTMTPDDATVDLYWKWVVIQSCTISSPPGLLEYPNTFLHGWSSTIVHVYKAANNAGVHEVNFPDELIIENDYKVLQRWRSCYMSSYDDLWIWMFFLLPLWHAVEEQGFSFGKVHLESCSCDAFNDGRGYAVGERGKTNDRVGGTQY